MYYLKALHTNKARANTTANKARANTTANKARANTTATFII